MTQAMARLQIILEVTQMSNNFSILLVLKDRPHYTLRLLDYLNLLSFPYKILIADGGMDLEVQKTLEEKSNFPNLNYEYLRHPYDETLDCFHEKMASAVKKIDTPTVSVMDNDDFMLSEGIAKCLKILKNNDNYSSARGAILGINISHDVFGHSSVGTNMYTKYPNSIISGSAKGRMIEQTRRFHGNWHNITRSNHIKASWGMINIVKPQNMRFTEQMTGYLNVLWGDGYRSDFSWLLHQHGQRIVIEGASLDSHYPEQKAWINSVFWPAEFNKMTEVIGVSIAEHDDISIEDALDIFTKTYPLKLPDLKDLLEIRIKESVKLGYNLERIDNLFKEIRKYNIKEIEPIGELDTKYPLADKELQTLSNFLLR